MSDPSDPSAKKPEAKASWMTATVVAVIMAMLALGGVGVSTAQKDYAATYWMALVPVYGLLCIYAAWRRSRGGDPADRMIVSRLVFHWLGIAAAMLLDFQLRETGETSALGTGLTALLLLAVGCFLAGVHFERRFCLVGILLAATLWVVVKADQYIWLIFLVGGVVIAGMLYLQFRHARKIR